MCGIAGVHFKNGASNAEMDAIAAHFIRALRHRGPDGQGVHRGFAGVFVGVRLAIVDRQGGGQPMHSESGTRGIVYNGEIYNHEELRSDLGGHTPFRTASDTEVVLTNWCVHGEDGFARLNGMFALCVWDDQTGTFVLARDRFGSKPLYVYEDERCIVFASELRAILGLGGIDLALDETGFQDYLTFRHHLAPYTQFRRIRRLQAGCWLRHENGQSRQGTFATVQVHSSPPDRPEAHYITELDGLLGSAVESQLMGEVPVGLLLSGGLDSSAIAYYLGRTGRRFKAYSVGLPETNEFEFSRHVSAHTGLDYIEVTVTDDELRRGAVQVIDELDEPLSDPACFALSRLCRRIRDDVTVALSGEGADEWFAGYHHYALATESGLTREQSFEVFFQECCNYSDSSDWLRNKQIHSTKHRYRAVFDAAAEPLAGMQTLELRTWMPESLMMKADKICMAHSLEGRFPFLDLNLVTFASLLPRSMTLPRIAEGKYLLRRLMHDRLPESILTRRKMGFTVPPRALLLSFEDRLVGAARGLRGTAVGEVLDLEAIEQLIRAYYREPGIPARKVWNLAVLLLWWTEVFPRHVAEGRRPEFDVKHAEASHSRHHHARESS